jgi:hypothetical protein
VNSEDVEHLMDSAPYGCADPDCELCADFFGSAKPTDHGGRVQAPIPLPSSGTATPEDYDLRPQQAKT